MSVATPDALRAQNAELCEALERAVRLIEKAEKATHWTSYDPYSTEDDEQPVAQFRALLAKACGQVSA